MGKNEKLTKRDKRAAVAASGSMNPLEILVLVDGSGSMARDGKREAVDRTLARVLLATKRRLARDAEVGYLRVLRYGRGVEWMVGGPRDAVPMGLVPLHEAGAVPPLTVGGASPLGEALDAAADALTLVTTGDADGAGGDAPPQPPAVLLVVSDGLPTDDYMGALVRLLGTPRGATAVRAAVGIGDDADEAALRAYATGRPGLVEVARDATDSDAVGRAMLNALTAAVAVALGKPFAPKGLPTPAEVLRYAAGVAAATPYRVVAAAATVAAPVPVPAPALAADGSYQAIYTDGFGAGLRAAFRMVDDAIKKGDQPQAGQRALAGVLDRIASYEESNQRRYEEITRVRDAEQGLPS